MWMNLCFIQVIYQIVIAVYLIEHEKLLYIKISAKLCFVDICLAMSFEDMEIIFFIFGG